VRNFEEEFCARHGVAPEHYVDAVLVRTLYPAGRWLRPVLALKPSYFTADRNFIKGVGRISRFSDFEAEVKDYLHDPENRGFFRRVLKLRVSSYQMLRLVRGVLRDNSIAPFVPGAHRR
jgi:hypothetical protein